MAILIKDMKMPPSCYECKLTGLARVEGIICDQDGPGSDMCPLGEVPTSHGRWIWRGGNLYECSECGAIVVTQDYIPIELHYFCRGCGAKMDK